MYGNVKRTEMSEEIARDLEAHEAKGEAEKALVEKIRETMNQLQ